MTLPVRINQGRNRLSDKDEETRRRARAISQMGKAYSEGAAQSDIYSHIPAEEAFNAAEDYGVLKLIRRKVKYPSPVKSK